MCMCSQSQQSLLNELPEVVVGDARGVLPVLHAIIILPLHKTIANYIALAQAKVENLMTREFLCLGMCDVICNMMKR